MKIAAIAAATIIAATSAHADTIWHCKGDDAGADQSDHPTPWAHTTIRSRTSQGAICLSPCIAGCIAQLAHGTTNGCGLGNTAQ